MGLNATGAGIAQGAKATADNFNNAFMACNGDTGSTGRIKTEKYFCSEKRSQSVAPNMDLTADVGVIDFFGTAAFPTGNSVNSIAGGENGQELTLTNNSDVPISIDINPSKPLILDPGCMVNLVYCANSARWNLPTSGAQTELCCEVEQTAHGFTQFQAVAIDATGNFILADANDGSKLASHVVVKVIDADNFKVQAFGPYDNIDPHGLDDCFYFQDYTVLGGITNITPVALNTYNNVLFRPINDTKIEILAGTRPYLIGDGSGGGGTPDPIVCEDDYLAIVPSGLVSVASGTNFKLVTFGTQQDLIGTDLSADQFTVTTASGGLFNVNIGYGSSPIGATAAVGSRVLLRVTRYDSSLAFIEEKTVAFHVVENSSANPSLQLTGSSYFNLNAGDQLRLRIFQNTGNAINTSPDPTVTYFNIARIDTKCSGSGTGGGSGAEPSAGAFVVQSAGAADAGKGVELDSNGVLDCSVRPIDTTFAYDGSNTVATAGSSTNYSPTNVTNGSYSSIVGSNININKTGLYRVEVDLSVSNSVAGNNGQIALTLIGASGGPRVINAHIDPDFAVSFFKGYTIIDATAGDVVAMSVFNSAANNVNVGSSAQESIISITKL